MENTALAVQQRAAQIHRDQQGRGESAGGFNLWAKCLT